MDNRITEKKLETISSVEKNIKTIQELEKETLKSLSTVDHLVDKITTFAGSGPFILLHIVWFFTWVFINTGLIPNIKPFDTFPFFFLSLIVSLEVIFLSLLVLMSQNRMTKEADKRAHLHLQINMLSEQETTMILRMVQEITKHLGIKENIDNSFKDLSEITDVNQVAKKIDESSNP